MLCTTLCYHIDLTKLLFQMVDVTEFNKLLGPQFNSEMFKDLLKILSEHFVSDMVPVAGILKQIIINVEFKIIKMFMDTEDRNGKRAGVCLCAECSFFNEKSFLVFSCRKIT